MIVKCSERGLIRCLRSPLDLISNKLEKQDANHTGINIAL